jgi:hypothetical protein
MASGKGLGKAVHSRHRPRAGLQVDGPAADR